MNWDFSGGSDGKSILPTMWETWVPSLGQEDPLEKEIATDSSILAWKIPWKEEPGRLQSMESQSQRRLTVISLSLSFFFSRIDLALVKVSCSIVQFSSVAPSCPTLCNPMNRSTPGLAVHHKLPKFTQLMSIELVMPSSHLILCHPLLLLPPIPPSIRVFSNNSSHDVAKVLEFQLQHQSFQWTPRTDLL